MSPSCRLGMDESNKNIDLKLCKGMINSLLYVTTCRPNILISVCMCTRFRANPKELHLNIIKRTLKYLNGTQNLGLRYSKQFLVELIDYSNSNFVRCGIGRKNTSKTC